MNKKKVILAFSGGLDTSFCIPYIKEKYNADVITVTVDTCGFLEKEKKEFEEKSKKLGAIKHFTIEGMTDVYNKYVSYIIKGNVLKENKYPMCVAAERAVQAEKVVEIAKKEKANAVAHGSTGAGNDQIRFDTAISTLAPEMEIITPIRTDGITRGGEIEFLEKIGYDVPRISKKYSINKSIWGITIGGSEIHDSWSEPSKETYIWTKPIKETPNDPQYIEIEFNNGLPVKLNGKKKSGIEILKDLNMIGGEHGYGRGIHLGDTIIGIKGRIVFEAPGTLLLIEAHRELENLVLTKEQNFWKSKLGDLWGRFLHHGYYFDPIMKDIEAFIDSSQKFVSGTVRIKLFKGNAQVVGCKSPYTMIKSFAIYGEGSSGWNGKEAEAFSKLYGLQSKLSKLARKENEN